MSSKSKPTFTPRLLRLKDAPYYLGMDKNRFNREVRPVIPEIKIGIYGVAFDKLDLDQWVDDNKNAQSQTKQVHPQGGC